MVRVLILMVPILLLGVLACSVQKNESDIGVDELGEGAERVELQYSLSVINGLPISKKSPVINIPLPVRQTGYQAVNVALSAKAKTLIAQSTVEVSRLALELLALPPRGQDKVEFTVSVQRKLANPKDEGWQVFPSVAAINESAINESAINKSVIKDENNQTNAELQKVLQRIRALQSTGAVYVLSGLGCELDKDCLITNKSLWLVKADEMLADDKNIHIVFDNPTSLDELMILLDETAIKATANITVNIN